jgi:hypothetical protein
VAQKIRNRNPKIVEIVDHERLIFNCKKCGQGWQPMLQAGGTLRRGAWQCPNGCKPDA